MTVVQEAERRSAICVGCAAALLGLALYGSPARAQTPGARTGILEIAPSSPLFELQSRLADLSVPQSLLALEGAVDPDEYVLGPGDMFKVTVGGLASRNYSISVSVAGFLSLPEAGAFLAAGRTLASVKQEALSALQERHANAPVDFSFVQPRMFYVHISGAVPQAGRYLMLPISRVDDVIHQAYMSRYVEVSGSEAGGASRFVSPASPERPEINSSYRPALRNVLVTHRDGSQHSIDLIRYYTNGETANNPYLQDGDMVSVPSFHYGRDGIRVSGQINYPGVYDLRPGDTALNMLTLAAGPGGLAQLGQIRLARNTPSGPPESFLMDAQRVISGADEPIALQAGDHLIVLTEEVAIARIQGRVAYPGSYNIVGGKTTLRELIEMAGGLKNDANLKAAFLERNKSLDFRESGRVSNLDFFSRDFARSFAANSATRVSVDIAAAMASDDESIVLYDGDKAVFPRDEHTAHVYGHVPQPGYVQIEEGQPASHYIDLVGGTGQDSQNIYVFDGSTGEVRVGAHVIVKSGDTVFVDRKDMAETPAMAQLLLGELQSKRQARIMTTQAIFTGLTAITSIVTAYFAIRRNN